MDRRRFMGVALGAAGAGVPAAATSQHAPRGAVENLEAGDGTAARAYWVAAASRLAEPVLTNLAAGTLKARMPVEEASGAGRATVSHLEAVGRLLCGIAPWLERPADASPEGQARGRFLKLAHKGLAAAVDPASPDFMNFTRERQPLVDAAFLGQALLPLGLPASDAFWSAPTAAWTQRLAWSGEPFPIDKALTD